MTPNKPTANAGRARLTEAIGTGVSDQFQKWVLLDKIRMRHKSSCQPCYTEDSDIRTSKKGVRNIAQMSSAQKTMIDVCKMQVELYKENKCRADPWVRCDFGSAF